MITHDTIPDYYDWLSRYVQISNWLAYRRRFASFTMHKQLRVSEEGQATRTAGVELVNDLLLKRADLPPDPRILDAGCGFGGTIFRWHGQIGGDYDGLTLSRVQARVARREARRRGIEKSCRFHVRSYDEPVPGTYDAVLAIESLIHSRDVKRTIPSLASSLRPGGRFLVVDDMASANLDEEAAADARLLREHWGCDPYPTQADYREALLRAGLAPVYEEDLTPRVQPRERQLLDRRQRLYSLLYRTLPLPPIRTVVSAFLGGLALERLYLNGKVNYLLIVAQKKP